jgi:hypothetical protein
MKETDVVKKKESMKITAQEPVIEDLTVDEDQAEEVKCGAGIYRNVNGTFVLISADVSL